MSKLTDKIEVLLYSMDQRRNASGKIYLTLRSILADVRDYEAIIGAQLARLEELEPHVATCNAEHTEQAYTQTVRNAMRNAYEHALHIAQTGDGYKTTVVDTIQAAIAALEQEQPK